MNTSVDLVAYSPRGFGHAVHMTFKVVASRLLATSYFATFQHSLLQLKFTWQAYRVSS